MNTKASTLLVAALALTTALPDVANAEDLYVRPDGGDYGAESGSDWENAFDGLAEIVWGSATGQVGPGDTVYLAGGRYTTNLVVGVDGAAGSWITIRRATNAAHGTDSGWQADWDSLVHLDGAYINLQDRSYVEVDGVTEWGIRISGLNERLGSVANIFIGADTPQAYSEYISIRNLELIGPGKVTCDGTRGIGVHGNYIRVDHLLISHVKAHEYSGACIRLGNHDDVVIENSMIYNVMNASAEACGGVNPHNTHIAMYGTEQNDNIVIRNNLLYQEYEGNRVSGGYAVGFGYVSGDVDVYNNVFFNVNNPSLTAENPMPTVAGAQIRFYNNTFVGYRTMVWGDGSSFDMVNNIFCNKGFDPVSTRWPYSRTLVATESRNVFCLDDYTDEFATGTNIVLPDGVDPFEDYDAPDIALRFRLRGDSPARNVGDDLSSVSTDDIEGHTRPSGSWDIGAYEYVEGGDKETPAQPAGLAAELLSDSAIRLTWTASTDNTAVVGYRVYQNGTLVGKSATTSYTDMGLVAARIYRYAVAAYDAAGNVSQQSAEANATTPGGSSGGCGYQANGGSARNAFSLVLCLLPLLRRRK